jgi:hypothetical protein
MDKRSRFLGYRGSIGILLIFSKSDYSSFRGIIKHYNDLMAFYKDNEMVIALIGIVDDENVKNKSNYMNEINMLNIEYYDVKNNDLDAINEILSNMIKESTYVQATIQGSCDISF